MRLIAIRLLPYLSLPAALAAAAAPVDFNREVRPILSEKCYHCHGPDEESRKAKLRLDLREEAIKERDGVRSIVPGRPDQSELMVRVLSKDPDEMMPPPKEHHTISTEEAETLRRWIAEGAPYARHWSFVGPVKAPVPAGVNAIDHFVSAGLSGAGLKLSPEAEPEILLRRLSLDLTGLPPTPEEVTAFSSAVRTLETEENRKAALDNAVARLLASPHFGERWARMWMDLARYADSSGYGSDFFRLNIWPWRDWVISAFNRNLPYDRFTLEQIAGDLLPHPTRDQLVATAFHRNTMTNFEGGTPDEEYRVAAVKDRVATTMQVWMGLTAGCAQCHSHKFDPLSMREYYQLFAIFNQTEDADRNDEAPKMPLPTAEEEQRKAELTRRVGTLEESLRSETPELRTEFEHWLQHGPAPVAWTALHPDCNDGCEDLTFATQLRHITGLRLELPAEKETWPVLLSELRVSLAPAVGGQVEGRFVRLEHDSGKLLQIAEVQVFSKGENVALKGRASQSSTYSEAAARRAIDGKTDGAYANGSVAHTADNDKAPYWEVDLGSAVPIDSITFWNRTEVPERIKGARVIVLDAKRKPVMQRIIDTVPQPSVSFDATGIIDAGIAVASADFATPGSEIDKALDGEEKTGWRVEPHDTDAHAAVFEFKKPLDVGGDGTLQVTLRPANPRYRISITAAAGPLRELPAEIRQLLALPQRDADQRAKLLAYYRRLSQHDRTATTALTEARVQLAAIKPIELPVLRELAAEKRRESHMLTKGNYLLPGEPVVSALPASFHPAPAGAIDRLALARWLMSAENPLTARVAVNRIWAQLFGAGLVESEEDFGTQGTLPSHPELLDWLAVDFMEHGWDVKRLIAQIVTSATYRQSSKITPVLLEKDPRDRLLSRYPRRRLVAEELRDQALAVAGLLSRKIGGPSVYPPQPDGLWNVAFNGGQNKYPTSTGEDRYRRGLYTFWRRTMPNPTMATFDAPSRETCTLRRVPTNTPLQAFVTLNDPVFVECAQALARRILRETPGDKPEARLRHALTLVLARKPDAGQIAPLQQLYERELAHYREAAQDAKTFASEPLGPLPTGLDPAEAAAWTAVANVLLNLDAFLTRS